MRSSRYSCQIFTKLETAREIFEKSLNIKFHENPLGGGRVVPCGQTTVTNNTNAHKNPMD